MFYGICTEAKVLKIVKEEVISTCGRGQCMRNVVSRALRHELHVHVVN